jgi:hypothetical protein
MSTIKIADLQFSGADLFADSESYLNELDDSALLANQIKGGTSDPIIGSAMVVASIITLISAATRAAKEILQPECPPPPPCQD